MQLDIASLLGSPERDWDANEPATDEEIEQLVAAARVPLPPEYLDLLRFCNGGAGDLDAAPLLLMLDTASEAISHNAFWSTEGQFSGYWFIGSNGGLESIAIDLRTPQRCPVVMIDCIAGESSAEIVAPTFADLIPLLGKRPSRPHSEDPAT